METATLSSKYQLVIPKSARQHLRLQPGTKFTVLEKGGVIFLIPQDPMRSYRGIARGAKAEGLREKDDRFGSGGL